MPEFSSASMEKLSRCALPLQFLFLEVVKHFDCTILTGFRGALEQDKAFAEGKSKLKFPNSKHNKAPAKAVDATPYPIDWNDTERQYYFAGFVMGMAERLGIKLRFGGDWDMDTETDDNRFRDLCHFELVD